jgi:hypothetical protein
MCYHGFSLLMNYNVITGLWALGDNIAFLSMCYLICTVVILDNLGNSKIEPKILGT